MAIIAVLSAAQILAQAPAPIFESAMIKASEDPEGRAGYSTASGKLTLENQTLKDCVRLAYGMEVAQPAAGSKWIGTERFDIEVQAGRAADEREMKAALRAVLEQRFKLAVHRESKTFPGFALVVAKGGLKILRVEPGPGHLNAGRASIRAQSASMANLAQALAVVLNAPVIDMTVSPGVYDFSLDWTPTVVEPGALTSDDQDDPNVLPDPPRGPSLFLAVEQQLGLKLERRKIPLDVLVIDRAQQP